MKIKALPKISDKARELAYKLDPDCWANYTGKPRHYKMQMEERRVAAIRQAQEKLNESR